MDVDPGCTIVRIKRKRDEEPLEALLVESTGTRRKKSRPGHANVQSIFQFVQTVEQDIWEDQARKDALRDQISRLAQSAAVETPAPVAPVPAPPSPVKHQTSGEERRYTIVKSPQDISSSPKLSRFPTHPPKILSAKDLAAKQNELRMYDAVLSGTEDSSPIDPEMENFLPMLQDYLKLNDLPAPLSSNSMSTDDYVYDVFYRRVGAPNLTSGNVATLTGLPPTDEDSDDQDDEVEDEADEDSNAEEYYKNDYPDSDESSWTSDELHHSESQSDDDDYLAYDEGSDGEAHAWR